MVGGFGVGFVFGEGCGVGGEGEFVVVCFEVGEYFG